MTWTRRLARTLLVAGAAATGSTVGAAIGSAAYFARRVVTPEADLPDDVLVLAHDAETVTFAPGTDPVVRGRYGVWLDGGDGHARVGDVLARDTTSVTRRLLAVDRGTLAPGPARWNQYYYWDRPSVSLGIPDEDVLVRSEVGALPGWIVRPETTAEVGRSWAVLVHGRGARKEETLRAVPVLRRLGWTSLVTAYRNDRDAPPGPGGRYHLGLSEWRDVEAAVAYALEHGASRVALFGWSMGGAVVLQLLDNSPLAAHVSHVVLDSAVVDWTSVLRHHARLGRIPGPLVRVASAVMADARGHHLVGIHEPLDLGLADWTRRADELRHPMLVIHSDGDDFVPVDASAQLARLRPDLVRFERWRVAGHCREWNTDPQRWEQVVEDFLNAE